MFLFDWFYGLLSSLGLYYKSGRILFLGLDNSGKTTLLQMLKYGRVQTVAPTFHPSTYPYSVFLPPTRCSLQPGLIGKGLKKAVL